MLLVSIHVIFSLIKLFCCSLSFISHARYVCVCERLDPSVWVSNRNVLVQMRDSSRIRRVWRHLDDGYTVARTIKKKSNPRCAPSP
jgi:hypothetical protein